MPDILAVGAGGFVGAALRYLIGLIPLEMKSGFPIKTFAVNMIGCFVIGLITGLLTRSDRERLTLFLKTGVCGGFTTFSSFALETGDLLKRGSYSAAALYMSLSMILGVIAALLGQYIVREGTV